MKKILNNKIYDTEKAQHIGTWDNGHCTSDFGYCSEDLYCKKNGEFFLHGEGGPFSMYAGQSGNNTGWGEKIVPIKYDEAQEWAEKHLNAEDYIAIFGEPEEDDTKAQIHVNLSMTAINRLKQAAQQRGSTVSGLIEQLISQL